LVKAWLTTNYLAEYFAFTLRGFEFLLDTIGAESKPKSDFDTSQSLEESKDEFTETSLEGSDLAGFFLEFAKNASADSTDKKSGEQNQAKPTDTSVDDVFKAPISDLAKSP
jgi:hypothetical protein